MARTSKTKSKPMSKELSGAIKAFKASSEVEEFYRFIHENNLRNEACVLTKLVLKKMSSERKRGKTLQ